MNLLSFDHFDNSNKKPFIAFSSNLGAPFFKPFPLGPNHGRPEERLKFSRIPWHVRAQKELDVTTMFS